MSHPKYLKQLMVAMVFPMAKQKLSFPSPEHPSGRQTCDGATSIAEANDLAQRGQELMFCWVKPYL